ncbi:putative sulfate exporter family transporter [Bacillus sp. es.034]|uniref:YeiH family protein n=1 Tax=Bacillus sp. es.034 TaxID=1761763 RepID=UPI000BF3ECA5|nr:putative sulfate exporter family transporter [Bacillus sp. es.034]PFG06613.1 putative integral membrane protein (TIGR00698 family) [Bacillus sp. es.034]
MQHDKHKGSILPREAWGLFIILLISLLSRGLGILFPLIGSLLFAILIGAILQNTIKLPKAFDPGIQFTLKVLLKVAIVFLGVGLSLYDILHISQRALWVIFFSVIIGISVTYVVGKWLRIDKRLSLLIGIGTSICGATAISAVKGIVGAKEDETAYALSTIVFFNLIAFVTYPIIGQLLDMSDLSFGIWAGTAVHDTSSAVAVGYAYGDEAGEVATTVKLARTLFLIPVMFILPFILRKKSTKGAHYKKAFPWFIFLFLAVSLLHTFGLIPMTMEAYLKSSSKFMIIMVMTAVGLQVKGKDIIRLGIKPLLTGLIASITCTVISLLLIL